MRYVIYCDESDSKGEFYSNFYGGAILRSSDQKFIEDGLNTVKLAHGLNGEAKWTKIGPYNETAYIDLVDRIFDFVESGHLKIRIMFTQNINRINHDADHDEDNQYLFFIIISLSWPLA